MKARNRVVAMLLAGGQGSRLKALTKKVAKPAVSFGGKYRIIDFALSNAANSDIRDVGILTQYKPFKLNSHLGNGSSWDLSRNSGGLRILSPFATEVGGNWYEGTANSIYENMNYLDELDAEYVLILSGDHIYKMDYNEILKYHKDKNSELTIAVMEVDWSEASRFGIMNTDENGKIVEFEEKPKNPKSNLASMGIYIFNWHTLKKYLIEDNKDENSKHDFGMNIIPKIIDDGLNVFAWKFDGYWKDVGTVRSYWQANLDLLNPDNKLDLYDTSWRIYTKNRNLPPHYVDEFADVKKSLINENCLIYGNVNNSVLFSSITVEKNAEVHDSVILSDTVIKKGAKLYNCVVAESMTIEENQVIGEKDSDKIFLVSEDGIEEC
ncbi:glucose-1-phosphate adenylyltransferase [Finegoldia magna]|uniref:glucose-1-phosphate adenylyltransferase n=1 Tax=Finegoldia magna TaxID=1260 RepID=UPI000763FEFC|nr:glucose-1-phosphate adenylyltransferase [Finegoldia magna]KXA07836.1 glucose-1-phosphate adenylyltransferase [Finegoldia magna]MDU1213302.1 glucose-1-phosphate adenylyltransferase [Finegoldia magna]MDU5186178.1 glucose-1-phosphate adenylyltransferase [Finegoldia magna]